MLLVASQDQAVFLFKTSPQRGRHASDLLKLQGSIGRNGLVPLNNLVDGLYRATHAPRQIHLVHAKFINDFGEIFAGGDSEIRVQGWISSHNVCSPPRYEQSPVVLLPV